MKYIFEPGDIVRLKSGSPDLTVEHIGGGPFGNDNVHASWFDDDNEYQYGDFPHAALIVSPSYTAIVDLWTADGVKFVRPARWVDAPKKESA